LTLPSGDTKARLNSRGFAAKYHTTTAQLADFARQAKPGLLIIYHYPNAPDEVFADMSARYAGQFVVGRDLDVY
jgi:ribonuclease BN (tRNA processing enzyme)